MDQSLFEVIVIVPVPKIIVKLGGVTSGAVILGIVGRSTVCLGGVRLFQCHITYSGWRKITAQGESNLTPSHLLTIRHSYRRASSRQHKARRHEIDASHKEDGSVRPFIIDPSQKARWLVITTKDSTKTP
ncbi:hypothetical protein J6590_067743 [Homalodisca vitripennis]|nr:hypothetical protein J6590_067743 [Homalodisca vitripennis]